MIALGRSRPAPDRGELVSLGDRSRALTAFRIAAALGVLLVATLFPQFSRVSLSTRWSITAVYLLLAVASAFRPQHRGATPDVRRRSAIAMVAAMLLVDGLFLAWTRYSSGSVFGPLSFLTYAHVVAVTLAASYRTGFKVAAWHSLMLFVTLYAEASGIVAVTEGSSAALPGGRLFWSMCLVNVGALWAFASIAGAFSSVNERELRTQKRDLADLSAVVRRIDTGAGVEEISEIVLSALCDHFGFTSGTVLALRDGVLETVAARGLGTVPRALAPGLDPILERAASDGGVRLVKRIDAVTDPRLASVLQGGRNVVVAPMIPARSGSLGFVILQRVGPTGVNPWVLSVIERYISHAALTLRNRTLRDELERSLSENRLLQDLLAIQNEQLEETVQIRTANLQEALEDLRIADGERRVLLSRLVAAQEDERHRVANDIHDDPLQKLAALSMQLQLLRGTARPETVEILDKMIVTVRDTMTSMRQMIFDLRPSALDEEGLGAAILELLQTRCLDLDFDVDDQLTHDPPDDLCVILYRIVQEALANVLKHAEATSVRVSLLERRDGVLVTVEDDGKGFQTPEKLRSAPGHLGLSSMRERAETAGGSCQIRSLPNCGTTVEVWIPRAPTVSDPRPVALDAGPLGPDDPVELTGANRTPWISTSTEVGVP